jgi:hypothetical protein
MPHAHVATKALLAPVKGRNVNVARMELPANAAKKLMPKLAAKTKMQQQHPDAAKRLMLRHVRKPLTLPNNMMIINPARVFSRGIFFVHL